MQNVLLEATSFDDAVKYLKSTPMTSPGHFIVAGIKADEGIAISRDPDAVARISKIGDNGTWYLVMTNLDAWRMRDVRNEKAVRYLESLG